MIKTIFGIYGASGLGKCVLPIAIEYLNNLGISAESLFFIDDKPHTSKINGHLVLEYKDFIKIDAENKLISLAISDSYIRKILAKKCSLDKVKLWNLSAFNSLIMNEVFISDGYILRHFSSIGPNVKIGKHFILGMYSYISHDCIVGDFVTMAPGAMCNGNVIIESFAYIGSGAIIKQGTPENPIIIGRGAIIGMGAVVTKSVLSGVTMVGNPARPVGVL